MNKGTVRWFNDTKGFGFIAGEDGQDYYVHYTGIVGKGHRCLERGQRVIYAISENKEGKTATNVIAE